MVRKLIQFLKNRRIGYCDCCGSWAWLRRATPARSTGTCFICDDCDAENDIEWGHAWAEYYGRRL